MRVLQSGLLNSVNSIAVQRKPPGRVGTSATSATSPGEAE